MRYLVFALAVLVTPVIVEAQAPPGGNGFFAFEPTFTGGIRVATCGPDGLGRTWLIWAAGPGGGPHVVAEGLGAGPAKVFSWYAYNPAFSGGVYVSCYINAVGVAVLLTGAGEGGGPHLRFWDLQ